MLVAGAGGNEHRAAFVPQFGQHQVASDVNLVHYQQLRAVDRAVMVGDHLEIT